MKKIHLLLALTFLSLCVTQTDNCYTRFEAIKREKCLAINSQACRFSSNINACFTTTDCTKVNDNECDEALPDEFNKYKCVPGNGGKCKRELKRCNDYTQAKGDVCEDLFSGDESGKQRCDISELGQCTPYYDRCEDIPTAEVSSKCTSNIPSDYTKKCVIDGTACKTENRECTDTFFRNDANLCPKLTPSDNKKKCIFKSSCIEDYVKCEDYTENSVSTCEAIETWNMDTNAPNILVYCALNSENKCVTKPKLCSDYTSGFGGEICLSYQAEDPTKKRCVYDGSRDECNEEYLTCALYNSNAGTSKNKEDCEKIELRDITKKCVFNENEQCVQENKVCSDYKSGQAAEYCTSIVFDNKRCILEGGDCIENYDKCEDYKGNDKKICETIRLDHSMCILRKDSKCVEKQQLCDEVNSEIMCKYAKASSDEKECIYYNGACQENYKKCEYATTYSQCEAIVQFDGKKCIYDSSLGICKQAYKTCNNAMNETECKMIAKT